MNTFKEESERIKKAKKAKPATPASEVYGNFAVKPLKEQQEFRVRAPSTVSGVRG
jgi:GDP-D-mannose dehydratase